MDHQHQHSCQEGAIAPPLPKAGEEICHATLGPRQILPLHHRERPDRFHHGLVRGIAPSMTARPFSEW